MRRLSAKDARRKKDEAPEKSEYAANRYTNDTKRQQQQPDQRIEQDREQRQRPADNEQDAPEQESSHVHRPLAPEKGLQHLAPVRGSQNDTRNEAKRFDGVAAA